MDPKNFSKALSKLNEENKQADIAYEPIRKGNPVENIVGQAIPYAVGSYGVGKAWPKVSTVFPRGREARRLHHLKTLAASPGTMAAVQGGLFGAMHQDSNAVMGAALGAGGYKAGQYIGRTLSRIPDELTDNSRRTVEWARREGFDLMPGLKSGNKSVQEVDRALSTNTKSSDWYNKIEFKNRKLATQIVADKLGLKGVDQLDSFRFREANDKISAEIDRIANKISARLNADDKVDLYQKIIHPFKTSGSEGQIAASKKLTKQWKRIYDKMAEVTPDRQDGRVLTGKQFQQIRRDFRNDIEAGFSNNATTEQKAYAQGLLKIQELLNTGVDRQGMMTAGQGGWSKQWRDANQKMRVLKDAQEVLTSGNNRFDGLIDPGKLYSVYRRDYPELMASGEFFDKDLFELANLGNLTKTQSGASLQASQQLGRVFNAGRGDPKVGLHGLLALGSTNAGPFKELGLNIYKAGWPFTTGFAMLPSNSTNNMGKLGQQLMLTGMGEDPKKAASNEYNKAASIVGGAVGDQYDILKKAANDLRNWDKIKELENYLTD
jgi:hypothetical protein